MRALSLSFFLLSNQLKVSFGLLVVSVLEESKKDTQREDPRSEDSSTYQLLVCSSCAVTTARGPRCCKLDAATTRQKKKKNSSSLTLTFVASYFFSLFSLNSASSSPSVMYSCSPLWFISMEHIKAFLGGSGADAFNDPLVVDRLLQLVPAAQTANGRAVHVAYLGTATYDLPDPQEKQTGELARRGCHVRPIRVADPAVKHLSSDDVAYLREQADVIVVSGGNTLYAVQRWERLGLDALLRSVATQGADAGHRAVVLAGGSAGAICWFTAGHSRSADPTTFRLAMLKAAAAAHAGTPSTQEGAVSADTAEGSWSYIRVHGLDILPGLLCPHFDIAQGDRSVRREEDFVEMLQRHPAERGVALDHWAVLIVPGDGSYEVFPVPGHTRQCGAATADAHSPPGLFLLDVEDGGRVRQRRVATVGRLCDLLRPPTEPVSADPLEAECAHANPAY